MTISIEQGATGFKVKAGEAEHYIGDFKGLIGLLDKLLDSSEPPAKIGRPRGSKTRKRTPITVGSAIQEHAEDGFVDR